MVEEMMAREGWGEIGMQVTGWLAPAAHSLTLSSDHGQEGRKDNVIVELGRYLMAR